MRARRRQCSLAAVISWAGTHSGKGISMVRWAPGSVLLVDGSQAFLGEAVRDTNESWP